jgi:hypothetical protein
MQTLRNVADSVRGRDGAGETIRSGEGSPFRVSCRLRLNGKPSGSPLGARGRIVQIDALEREKTSDMLGVTLATPG